MRASQTLPPNYRRARTFDLKSTPRLLALNLLGLGLLVLCLWLFGRFVLWVRPADGIQILVFKIADARDGLRWTGVLLLISVLMVVVHEGLHGVFFWYFTRQRPHFAFKGAYAYAAAPGWYLPRNQYLITALAPLVVITLLGMIGLAQFPSAWVLPTLLLMSFNASGAVGDLWVALGLLRQPAACLALDQGDAATLFVPED